MKKLIAVMLLCCAGSANSAGFDLALSSESANLAMLFNPPSATSNAQVGVGALFNDLDDVIFHVSALALGPASYNGDLYSLGAGIKLYGGDLDVDQSVGALAIGGRFGLYLIRHPVNPVDIEVEGFYAPGITSAGDTNSLWEFSSRLRVEIIRSARAYLGYRLMEVDTEEYGDVEVDDNLHIGISIDFY